MKNKVIYGLVSALWYLLSLFDDHLNYNHYYEQIKKIYEE